MEMDEWLLSCFDLFCSYRIVFISVDTYMQYKQKRNHLPHTPSLPSFFLLILKKAQAVCGSSARPSKPHIHLNHNLGDTFTEVLFSWSDSSQQKNSEVLYAHLGLFDCCNIIWALIPSGGASSLT